jgi:hypothetical protein
MTQQESINEVAFATLNSIAQIVPDNTPFETIKLLTEIIFDRAMVIRHYSKEDMEYLKYLINNS